MQQSCALWATSGMHSMALHDCISHEKFCNHFNIHFERKITHTVDHTESKSEPKHTQSETIKRPFKISIQEHKQLSSTKLFQRNSNDKADDSDYPDLTSDSGVDSDSDSDDEAYFSELQVSSLTSQLNNQIDFISSNINGPVYNSESKNPEVFCCKCHAQGAKCINC